MQYASVKGTTWQITELTGAIPANSYFLIQQAEGSGGTEALPTPDVIGTISMAGKEFKVALVNNTTQLTGACPAGDAIVDFLGNGTANCYEGSAAAPAVSNSTASIRKEGGCQDTDDNSEDFVTDAPTPRNTASPTHSCGPTGNPDALFFSEYIEGSSNNKAIEIYNATGGEVDLSDIKVELYTNGRTTITNVVTLEGTLANNDVFVIANAEADTAILAVSNITSNVTFYNGNDALVLRRVSTNAILDSFGRVGEDPGAGWGSGDTYTVDRTLVRKPEICAGDTIPDDAFEPADEWLGYAKDTFSYLGSHTANCGETPPVTGPTVASIEPENNASAPADTNITITFSENVTVADGWYSITCTESGAHTANVTEANPVFTLNPDIDFDAGESCTVAIDNTKVTNADDEPMAAPFTSSFKIPAACGTDFTPIYAIQGDGDASPIADQIVTTQGVVTGNFQEGGKRGYYIQALVGDDNPATSDGIFVYSTTPSVNLGDLMQITGQVTEYYEQTQITPTNADVVLLCSTGHEIAPTEITLPVDVRNYEPYEGMLVSFPQALYIAEYYDYDRYGEIVLSSSRHSTPTSVFEPGPDAIAAEEAYQLDMIKLDDTLTSQNPPWMRHPDGSQFTKEHYFRGGDTVTDLTGIMDYNFDEWKIQPVGTATYTALNPRPEAPDMLAGEIRIASLNVLNYFVTLDGSGDICGPAGNMNCRGADNENEFGRQHAKIIAAILGMQADVIGLIEIENEHPAMDADGAVINLVNALNAETAPGTYAYVATGSIGTDAIKQAILYKTEKVDPVGTFAVLDETFDPLYNTMRNRPSLAASFKDKITDEIFTVSVNHFKSKGSACDGDPDMGDGQGNCNQTRLAAAQVLVRWLETDPTNAGSDMYVIIGDLNAYAKEDPIDAIKLGADGNEDTADDVLNLVERFMETEAYGYVFDGRTGYLDHALGNRKFASYVLDAHFWHINADEADVFDYNTDFKPPAQQELWSPDVYRSSDHDPVLISLILNHPPVANDDAYSTNMGVTLEIAAPGVLENDTDANVYDKITATLVEGSGPANGELTLNLDGSFTYIPNDGFTGTDTFDYIMHATPGLMAAYSDTATVTISVNQPPEFIYPIEDKTVNEETQLNINFQAEDADGPVGNIVYSISDAPEGATFSTTTGLFTWTPTEAQGPGEYTIIVQACDPATPPACATATVKITVLEVNKPPVINPIPAQEVDEEETLTFTATGSDPDIPAQTLTFSLEDAPTGAMIDPETGVFTWTPTEAQGPGEYTIIVQACDPATPPACATATVKITVLEVNKPPVLEPIPDQEVIAGDSLTFTASASDPDLPPQTLTFSLKDAPDGATIDPQSGAFSWAVPLTQAPGEITFTVKVCDDFTTSACATQTVKVTVKAPNQAPEFIYPIEDKTVNEETQLNINFKAEDADGPVGNIVYSISDAPEGATFSTTTGLFTWTPTEAQGPGEYTIIVQACDPATPPACATATVKITVLEVNKPPVINPIPAQEVDEEETLTFTATGSDPDIPAQTLTFSLEDAPTGAMIDPETGVFTWTPDNTMGTQDYSFKVCISDGIVKVCTTVVVTVNNIDFDPVAVDDAYTTDEDTVLTVDAPGVLGNDSDPNDDPITAIKVSDPANGNLVLNADGSFTYTPNQDYNGTDSFTYQASDGENSSNIATVTITINPINDAPVAEDDTYSVDEDSVLEVAAPGVLTNDSDVDGDVLNSYIRSNPEHGVVEMQADGSFVYTPEANFYGTDTFTYTLSTHPQPQGAGWTDWATVTINVNAVNDPPELDPINDATVPELESAGFQAVVYDPDSENFTFTLIDAPEGASIHPELGIFEWIPSEAQGPGVYTMSIRVCDDATLPLCDEEEFTITVTEVNEAPVLDEIGDKVIEESEELTFTATATDPDIPAQTLIFTLVGAPEGASIDSETGEFSWIPTRAQLGEHSFDVCVSDGELEDCETITVTVTLVNDAPVAMPDEFTVGINEILTVGAPGVLENDSDADDDPLSAELVQDVEHGILVLFADGSFLYIPVTDFVGEDSFSYKAFDGNAYSEVVTVTITVTAPPVWKIYFPIIVLGGL